MGGINRKKGVFGGDKSAKQPHSMRRTAEDVQMWLRLKSQLGMLRCGCSYRPRCRAINIPVNDGTASFMGFFL